MSYITRTSSIVMVDASCLREALDELGATRVNVTSKTVEFTHQGTHHSVARLANGALSWNNRNHGTFQAMETFVPTLVSAYQGVVKARELARKKEQKRLADLQKRLAEMGTTTFEGLKHEALKTDHANLQAEIAASKQELTRLEAEAAAFEESRERYLTTTKELVEEKAASSNWSVSAMQEDRVKRQTRIQLRRKVSN